jgi:hypothetical protein
MRDEERSARPQLGHVPCPSFFVALHRVLSAEFLHKGSSDLFLSFTRFTGRNGRSYTEISEEERNLGCDFGQRIMKLTLGCYPFVGLSMKAISTATKEPFS